MAKKSIEDIVHGKYDDEDVANHVLQSVKEAATADRIVSGELVLPSREDALRNYQIASGQFAATPGEAKLRDENNKLMDRLEALEATVNKQAGKRGQ